MPPHPQLNIVSTGEYSSGYDRRQPILFLFDMS